MFLTVANNMPEIDVTEIDDFTFLSVTFLLKIAYGVLLLYKRGVTSLVKIEIIS